MAVPLRRGLNPPSPNSNLMAVRKKVLFFLMAFTSRDVEARSRVIRFIYKSKEKVKVLVDMSTKKITFFLRLP